MPVAKAVLIVQLSAAVTARHRKAESFFTAFQRTTTGKVTSRITLFNINLDRVSLAVACTNNSSRYRPCSGSGSSHWRIYPTGTATGLKKHIVSYQMSPKVSLLGYRKRLETLCCQILCQLYCQCESCFQHIYVMLCDDFCGNVYVCLSIYYNKILLCSRIFRNQNVSH